MRLVLMLFWVRGRRGKRGNAEILVNLKENYFARDL